MKIKKLKSRAHSESESGRVDYLWSHLQDVANRASEYASAFGAPEEAWLAGILHDLGKYGRLFQERLRNPSISGIDHWSAGAWAALTKYEVQGVATALAIQGHHLGLLKADNDSLRGMNLDVLRDRHPQRLRLSEPDLGLKGLLERLANDGLMLRDTLAKSVYEYSDRKAETASAMLDVRMLFSVLVDADFVETEAHFRASTDGSKCYRKSGPPLQAERALSILTTYQGNLSQRAGASHEIKKLRGDLLNSCLEAATLAPGLYTLTAPTGAGKTLSMLAFALRHAREHNLRRLVFVIPYLNIIEQTVNEYQEVFKSHFGDDYILEDHSLAGAKTESTEGEEGNKDNEDESTRQRNLLAQNWDAPIIVTTSVQLLESLFANRPSACRKLHRLAKSVILFDEVQTMPVNLIVPTLAALSRLVERYGSTVVFSTATQPAFSHLDGAVTQYCRKGWKPKEIVPPNLNLFDRTRRTRVQWPRLDNNLSWSELAEQLTAHKQALCIVNLKRHAHSLYDELEKRDPDSLWHLSTNMCPVHRKAVLEKIRGLIEKNEACRVISTQCVEAGVDIDFPVVYRALGPLDAIAQAAGRCNRNGRSERGNITIFLPEDEDYPPGAYKQAAGVTRIFLNNTDAEPPDIDDPQLFERYYRRLYDIARPENLNEELRDAIKEQNFEEVAKLYRVIEKNAINVLVAYDTNTHHELREEAERTGLTREWIAKARPHSISLFRPRDDDIVWNYLDPVPVFKRKSRKDEWFIYTEKDHYHPKKGLVPPSEECLIG